MVCSKFNESSRANVASVITGLTTDQRNKSRRYIIYRIWGSQVESTCWINILTRYQSCSFSNWLADLSMIVASSFASVISERCKGKLSWHVAHDGFHGVLDTINGRSVILGRCCLAIYYGTVEQQCSYPKQHAGRGGSHVLARARRFRWRS